MSPLDPTLNNRYIPRTPGPARAPAPGSAEGYASYLKTAERDPSKRRKPQPPPPAPDAAEVVGPWDQRFVINTTPISSDHRHLLYNLHLKTGKTIRELLDHAIENTYGSKH